MSSASINVSLLASSQPITGGINLVVNVVPGGSPFVPVISFQYFVYPGDNANGNLNNAIYNRTVNVGSEYSAKADNGVYSLFVDTTTLFPNYDYHVIVLALYSDGTQSPYSTPVLLPLTPAPITLDTNMGVTLTRDPSSYATTATINVFFDQVSVPIGSAPSTIVYNLGIQYKVANLQVTKFIVVPNLEYVQNLSGSKGGVTTTLTDLAIIDEAWVAIQSVRILDAFPNQRASSQLSNTVLANDTNTPTPPRQLTGVYNYELNVPNIVLSWLPSYYEQLGDIKGYNVYRNGIMIDFVPQRIPADVNRPYIYVDDSLSSFVLGETISYNVTTVALNNQESGPSNTVSFDVIFPNSAPVNLNAIGVADLDALTQDIIITFLNPTNVYGNLRNGYELAFFEVAVLDLNDRVISSQTLTYSDILVDVNFVKFNNLPFTPTDNVQAVLVKTRLITFQDDGSQLLGKIATTSITIGPKPIFLSLNGFDPLGWTKAGLVGYLVISPTLLTGNTITSVVKADLKVNLSEVNVVPTIFTDPYGPFDGCYKYTVNPPPVDQDAVIIASLMASNVYGTSQPTIIGSIL
jgi:hypothetical protein